jgi:hypothetical protein
MTQRDSRRGRGPGRRFLIAGAAFLLALALGTWLLERGRSPAAAGTEGVGLLAPTTGEAAGGVVDGISSGGTEQVAFHIHAHLGVYVNGDQRAIPYGIGVLPPLQLQQTAEGPFVTGGAGFYWLHTHDITGVIHIESPVQRQYTLGEFFDLWGQPLTAFRVGPERGPVTALVDGTQVGGDPRDIPLSAHAVIQLDVGAVHPFQPYTFAPGL